MRRNYEDPVYKDWRMKVYKRDKFTCQMPSCDIKSIYKPTILKDGLPPRF